MSYETAPATRMLATLCACCARPLVDAVSVETGIGPDCRKRHGYAEAQSEPDWETARRALLGMADIPTINFAACTDPSNEAAWRLGGLETRRVANLLVHRIACAQDGPDVAALTNAVRAIGYTRLAARIDARLAIVQITEEGDSLLVESPYSEGAVAAFRAVPGRRFEKRGKRKLNIFPASARRMLFAALCAAFPGETASGPKGLFILEVA